MVSIRELIESLRLAQDLRKNGAPQAEEVRIGKRRPKDGTFDAKLLNGNTERGIKTSNGGTITDQIVRGIKGSDGFWGLDWKNTTDEKSLETEKLIGEILIAYKYKLIAYLSILFKVIRENDPTPCTCPTYKRVGNRCFPVCDGSGKPSLEECLAESEPTWPPTPRQPQKQNGERISVGGSWHIWVGYSQGFSKWNPQNDGGVPEASGHLWIPEEMEFCGESSSSIQYAGIERSPQFWEIFFDAPGFYGGSIVYLSEPVPGFINYDRSVYSPYVVVGGLGDQNYVTNMGNDWVLVRYCVFVFPAGTPLSAIEAAYNTNDLNNVAALAAVHGVQYSASTFTRGTSLVGPPYWGGNWGLQSRTDGLSCSPFVIVDSLCADPGQGNPPKACPFPQEKRSITYYIGGSKKTPCECVKFNYSDTHKLYFSAIDGYGKDDELTSVEIVRILCGSRRVGGGLYYCKQIDIFAEGRELTQNTISYPDNFAVVSEDWRHSLLSTQASWEQGVTLSDTGKEYLDENRYKTNVNIISDPNNEIHHLIEIDNQQLIGGEKFIDLIDNEIKEQKVILRLSQFIGGTSKTNEPIDFKIGKVYGLVNEELGIVSGEYQIVGYSGYIGNIDRLQKKGEYEETVKYSSPLYCKSSQKLNKEIILAEDLEFLAWDFIISLVKDKFIIGIVNGLNNDRTEFLKMTVSAIQQAKKTKDKTYQNPSLPPVNNKNLEDSYFQSYEVDFDVPDECYTEWLTKEGVTFLGKTNNTYSLAFVDLDQKLPMRAIPSKQKKLKYFLLTHKGKTKAEIEYLTIQPQGDTCLILKRKKKKIELFGLGLSEKQSKKMEIVDIVVYSV